jgi:hypothetical protein
MRSKDNRDGGGPCAQSLKPTRPISSRHAEEARKSIAVSLQ